MQLARKHDLADGVGGLYSLPRPYVEQLSERAPRVAHVLGCNRFGQLSYDPHTARAIGVRVARAGVGEQRQAERVERVERLLRA